MDSLQLPSSGSSLDDTVDIAYKAVVRLDSMLRDWPAAPSVLLRLQETMSRLHSLLVNVVHEQDAAVVDHLHGPSSSPAVDQALSSDLAFTRSTLELLEGVLEGAQGDAQQGGSSPVSRVVWVQRSTVAKVKRELDECYQRLLVRLMALNV